MSSPLDLLDMLNEELKSESKNFGSGTNMPVKKLNYSHEALIDMVITNPGISQNAIAAKFGYSASWISQVMSSDMFQEMLAKRREEIVDPAVRATVEENFKGLISRSMDLLKEKLNAPAKEVGDQLVLRTLEISSRALGYGARTDPQIKVEVNVNDHLEKLGGNLVKLLEKKKQEVIEGSCLPGVSFEED